MKTIASKNWPEDDWVALLAVDFTPSKVFAWDADCGKAAVQEVRSRLAEDFATYSDPHETLWSDDRPGAALPGNPALQMRRFTAGPPSGRRVRRGVKQNNPYDARGRATLIGARHEGAQGEAERSHLGGAWDKMAGPPASLVRMGTPGSAGRHTQD